jgi:hypothetical protein
MLDCSRNAVVKPQKVKEFIDVIKSFGYTSIMLYLEDTFEVTGEPLFGYLRGRYSKAELKDIDAYANANGIELIPCVQTLAHLNAIFRWQEYAQINDINDVLLVGDKRTNELIDRIFETVSECFTCKMVNVGLDEAHMLGRGKYLDKFGASDRFELFAKHLQTVNSLAKKHGLTPLLWSDTFFEKGTDGIPYENLTVPKVAKDNLPENVGLICWDYYHTEKEYYDKVLSAHKVFKNQTWFACSAYSSRGFAPCNAYSFKSIQPALESCKENGIENVIVTMWGGNGAECSFISLLPSLFFASQIAKGNSDISNIAKKFNEITGEDFYGMTALDLPNNVGVIDMNYGPSKYMLYNDVFSGIYDCTINPEDACLYAEYALKLKSYQKNSKYEYVFDTLIALCDVLACKYTLGLDTRKAYKEKNLKELSLLIERYDKLLILLEKFYATFKKQWHTDNKPQGFDVQDIRLGGLMQRIKSCKESLTDFINGRIEEIPELEQEILDFNNKTNEFSKKTVVLNDYRTNVTVNIL